MALKVNADGVLFDNVNASGIVIVLEMMKVGYCRTEWEGENGFLQKQLH